MSWESDRYSAPTDNDIDTLSTVDWSAGVGYAGLVAEFYGNAGMSRQGGPENSFRVTANNVYANIAGNLQTSIYGAWGLSDDADDWEAGIAFSFWRQPWTKEHVEAEIEMDTDGG